MIVVKCLSGKIRTSSYVLCSILLAYAYDCLSSPIHFINFSHEQILCILHSQFRELCTGKYDAPSADQQGSRHVIYLQLPRQNKYGFGYDSIHFYALCVVFAFNSSFFLVFYELGWWLPTEGEIINQAPWKNYRERHLIKLCWLNFLVLAVSIADATGMLYKFLYIIWLSPSSLSHLLKQLYRI